MRSFKTNDGQEWQLSVNVLTVKRCRELTGINVLGLVGEQSAIADLFTDDVRLCEVLCACIKPQLDAAGKTADDFYATVDGDVIEKAAEALLDEVVNFFQEPRRGLLKKAMAKYQKAAEKMRREGAAEVEKRLKEIDFETLFRQTLTNSASSSRGPAA